MPFVAALHVAKLILLVVVPLVCQQEEGIVLMDAVHKEL